MLRLSHGDRYLVAKHHTIVLFFGVIAFITLAFVPDLFDPDSGLQDPEPVGPYLNGVFTDAPTPGTDYATYTIENAFPNLTFNDPVKMLELPSNKFMVFSKSGYAWIFNNYPLASTKILVLNVNSQTQINEDGGMLGAALHPE